MSSDTSSSHFTMRISTSKKEYFNMSTTTHYPQHLREHISLEPGNSIS